MAFLLPEVTGALGGIQRYLGDLLEAYACVAGPDAGGTVAVLRDREPPPCTLGLRWLCAGRTRGEARRRALFTALAARAAGGADLIVCGHVNLAPVAVALGRLLRTPCALNLYGIEVWGRLSRARRAALRRAQLLLPISRYTAERVLAAHGPVRGSVELLPCMVDAERFRPRLPGEPAPSEPTLLTVARLTRGDRDKGVETVLRALPQVLRELPEARHVVIGEGDDRPRLEALARFLGVADHVEFRGAVSVEALAGLYRSADVFVMPSRKEGFGIVFLEALASGVPVIAGDRDGAREPLRGGDLGTLVDPDDPGAVAEAIVRILRRTVASRLTDGRWLREQVMQHFGREAFRARVRQVLVERHWKDVQAEETGHHAP